MQKSETIGEIGKALAIAQGKIEGAKKDSENPFFKSKYADLAAVWDACRGPLSENGIAVVQTPRTEILENATVIFVGTLLIHSSGEWISEELSAIPVKDDPQGIGSCVTYLRRYALSAFTGVAPEDDDGNAASQSNGKPVPVNKARAPKPVAEDVERLALMRAIKEAGGVLNSLGDTPPWTASRCNAFANENFNISTGVDGLTTPQLSELAKLMANRIGSMKAPAATDPEEEKNRKALLKKIKAEFKPEILTQNMKQIFPRRELESLSHDELLHFETESVPF